MKSVTRGQRGERKGEGCRFLLATCDFVYTVFEAATTTTS